MTDFSWVRDITPLGLLALFVVYGLPMALKQVSGVVDTVTGRRLELASQPFEILKTSLERERETRDTLSTRLDLLAMEFMGLRARMDETNTLTRELKDLTRELSTLVRDLIHYIKKDPLP